ncbi:MAG: hypothetical protein KDB22_16335 [Planctomycetales bacterium]|nr:hypothetical protein [Planctomycetales bacterium]
MTEKRDTLDQQISIAIRDVEIPPNLAERLRSNLRRQVAATSASVHNEPLADPLQPRQEAAPNLLDSRGSGSPQVQQVARRPSWGRRSLVGVAMALGISFLLVSLRPADMVSHQDCVNLCIARLEALIEQPQSRPTEWNQSISPSEAGPVWSQLSVEQMQLVSEGCTRISAARRQEGYDVWKLRSKATGESLYLVHLKSFGPVRGATGTMQPFRGSGISWSVASMVNGSDVYVVLCKRDIERYLARRQFT